MLNYVMAGMNIGEIARLSYISRKLEHIKSVPSAQEMHAVDEIQAVMLESAMLRMIIIRLPLYLFQYLVILEVF